MSLWWGDTSHVGTLALAQRCPLIRGTTVLVVAFGLYLIYIWNKRSTFTFVFTQWHGILQSTKYTCLYLKSSHLSQASTKYWANSNCSTVFPPSWCPIPSCWFTRDLVGDNTTYGKFNIGRSTLIKVDTGDSHSPGPSRFFMKHKKSHIVIYTAYKVQETHIVPSQIQK